MFQWSFFLKETEVSDDILEAILNKQGLLGKALKLAECVEKQNLEEARGLLNEFNVCENNFADMMLESYSLN